MADERSNPKTMKAVFLEKPYGPLIVKEVNIPEPGPNDVLIKISAAPINPSDLARLKDADEESITTLIPGIEGSGTVVAAGKGILPRLWMGKRVACSSVYDTSGTWAEYMVTKAGSCFPLSRDVNDEQGSMSLVNPLTALAFFEIVKQNGHKALINNAAGSALGRMVELLGRKHRISVINLVRSGKQVETLKAQGSKYVLDTSEQSFTDNLRALSEELRATVLFDSVCSSQLQQIIDILPRNSSVIIYGNLSGEENIKVNPRSLIGNNIRISGFYLANQAKANGLFKNMLNIRKVSHLMSTGMKINIQNRFPLDGAQKAVETYLNNMSGGKVLLVPNQVE
jgi:NADPH:quinone reductase